MMTTANFLDISDTPIIQVVAGWKCKRAISFVVLGALHGGASVAESTRSRRATLTNYRSIPSLTEPSPAHSYLQLSRRAALSRSETGRSCVARCTGAQLIYCSFNVARYRILIIFDILPAVKWHCETRARSLKTRHSESGRFGGAPTDCTRNKCCYIGLSKY